MLKKNQIFQFFSKINKWVLTLGFGELSGYFNQNGGFFVPSGYPLILISMVKWIGLDRIGSNKLEWIGLDWIENFKILRIRIGYGYEIWKTDWIGWIRGRMLAYGSDTDRIG